MKVTNEQFEKAANIYWSTGNFRDAIESLPEPLPRLRPLTEMPPEVPEGALRLFGCQDVLGNLHMSDKQKYHKRLFLDVLPPLPESPKPSLQDELVTAVESYFEVWDNKDKKPGWCGRVEVAKNRVNELITKAKGGQQ